jgi:hypothetical protein
VRHGEWRRLPFVFGSGSNLVVTAIDPKTLAERLSPEASNGG